MVAEERPEQLISRRRRKRVDLHAIEAGPTLPIVLELGPVLDEQQQPRGRDPVEQVVEERLRLGVGPLQILEDQHERPALGLLQDHVRERVDDPFVPLARVEPAERIVRR